MPLSLPEARALYDSGAPVTHVAAALGLKAGAFRKLRLMHNWPLRPSPIVRRFGKAAAPKTKTPKTEAQKIKPRKVSAAKQKPAPPTAPDGQAAPPVDGEAGQVNLPDLNLPDLNLPEVNLPAFRRQVAETTQQQLAKIHKTLASGTTEDVERNARLLASLVKSLAELRRLEALDPLGGAQTAAVEGQDDQRPPRDLDTLRDELARALERMSDKPGDAGAGE
ncbi:MAG: hypothetical protein Q8M31_13870 [Beijerinckiaceae bacterium]|nr:hypothetical protein [Beijerinckiaceae bacterium]